ncbi:hypothetical protein, partial [Crocosphaera watsonii]|uniref:hypothetical protein n=1 Tax=Crocosphaera watsonii TaxID=263511 RepID=UPI000651C464
RSPNFWKVLVEARRLVGRGFQPPISLPIKLGQKPKYYTLTSSRIKMYTSQFSIVHSKFHHQKAIAKRNFFQELKRH